MDKKGINELDIMKVIMTLLVILGHVCRMYSPYSIIKPNIESNILNNISSFIYSFHMPAFVCISGIIYYHIKRNLKRYNDEYKFIKKKIYRLIIPYIFFSLFIVVPTMYFIDYIKIDIFKFIIQNYIFCLDNRHLWYLIMLFGIFIIFNHYEKYFYNYPSIFFPILFIISSFHSLLTSFFGISNIAHYFIFFYLGYLYEKNKKSIYPYFKMYLLQFIYISGALLCCFWLVSNMVIDSFYLIMINYMTALMGIIFTYLISVKLSLNSKITNNMVIINLNKNSYAIFLFHPMIIYLLFFILTKYSFSYISPFLFASIIFIISIIASIILTYIFRRIKLYIVLGENLY